MNQNISNNCFLETDTGSNTLYYTDFSSDIAPFFDIYSSDDYEIQNRNEEELFEYQVCNEEKEVESVLNSSKVSKTKLSSVRSKRERWTEEEDEKLTQLVEPNGSKFWSEIASKMDNRDKNMCRSRWNQYLKKKGAIIKKNIHWTSEDNIKLYKLVEIYGRKWEIISKKMITKTRIQCCNHYHYLKSNVTSAKNKRWLKEEDSELLSLVSKYGSSDWTYIASKLSTERDRVQCCNRYNGYLKFKLLTSTPLAKEESLENPSLSLPLLSPFSATSLNEFDDLSYAEPSYQLSKLYELIQNQINHYNSLYPTKLILIKD